jgi:hypothetical protein
MRVFDQVPGKRVAAALAALAAVALLATGCRPEPAASPTPSGSVTVDEPTPGPSVTPIETELPDAGLEVPASCEQIYSAAMIGQLQADGLPLNDPGVTMLSTADSTLLDLIHSGAPTLRCTWGHPSEYGLATNVTAISAEQEAELGSVLASAGYGCEPLGDGTVCRIEQRGVSLDDQEYKNGETHYIGAGAVVTTAWLNIDPAGYTEDIVATLWG